MINFVEGGISEGKGDAIRQQELRFNWPRADSAICRIAFICARLIA